MTKAEEYVLYLQRLIAMSKPVSLSSIVKSDDGESDTELQKFLQSDEPTPEELIEEKEKNDIVWKLLYKLNPREQLVLIKRFGLETGQPRTLESIAGDFGVTRERIRQIERRALKNLKIVMRQNGYHNINDFSWR